MEFRVLKYFLAVAREKNISKAAKSLHLSQPTLSKQLKELEEELGVILFERGNREISLTEEGIFLLSKASEILSLVEKTTLNLQKEEVVAGEVYIGGGETRAMSLIAKIAKHMVEQYPDIKIRLFSGNADDVMAKLDNGLLDFGVIVNPANKQKYDHIALPQIDVWGLLVRRDHFLAHKQAVLPEDLIDIPLLISQQSLVSQQIFEWFGHSLEELHIVGSYNLLYNASLMVEQGIGAAFCINGIINTVGTDLKFVPLKPKLEASLSMIWKKNHPMSIAATKFLENLKAE
ncbi:LysR family transcriptional regulator [Paenilisteria rocourtiae]|uniref:DNA-binding transcriptional LysR family regulator n=1 Tax=Listeria rocourtiae TaxID=647910 RepID=A0A4R6ZG00_9LIST|nr:LysR family transcriptional regulator [Listeria rocourtiae]TDR51177.1 DNA-binding transcriptional LysR family regulator [Listeria rocourtiae]